MAQAMTQATRQSLWERDTQRQAQGRRNGQVEKLLEKEAATRASIQKMTAPKVDGAGVEWKWDKKTRWWWWRYENGPWQSTKLSWTPPNARRQSDAESVASEAPSMCSTTATLTLSLDEEKELVKLEKRRCEIAALKECKAKGETLNKYQESAIRSEKDIDYAPVMVKVRAFGKEQAASLLAEEPPSAPAQAAQAISAAPVQAVPDMALSHAPASAPPAQPKCKNEEATEHEGMSLSRMVATIRRELDLDDSLTMAEVIAEGNSQVDMPATGNLVQQARSLFRELSSR
jgi:hypothetical protein